MSDLHATACALLSAAMFWPGVARGDGGEFLLAAEPALGLASRPSPDAGWDFGLGGSLSGWLGLTQMAWLSASVAAEAPIGGGSAAVEGVFGVVFALDVFRTVPFVEATGGLRWRSSDLAPVLRLGLGADYLLTPAVSLGAVARARPLVGGGSDTWLTFHLRLAVRGDL